MILPHNRTILVLDDEPLIAHEIGDAVLDIEGTSVVLAHDLEQGLRQASMAKLDFAVLDFDLGEETDSIPVAEFLIERGVPFAFVTGHIQEVRSAFPYARIVAKPVDLNAIAVMVRAGRP